MAGGDDKMMGASQGKGQHWSTRAAYAAATMLVLGCNGEELLG